MSCKTKTALLIISDSCLMLAATDINFETMYLSGEGFNSLILTGILSVKRHDPIVSAINTCFQMGYLLNSA